MRRLLVRGRSRLGVRDVSRRSRASFEQRGDGGVRVAFAFVDGSVHVVSRESEGIQLANRRERLRGVHGRALEGYPRGDARVFALGGTLRQPPGGGGDVFPERHHRDATLPFRKSHAGEGLERGFGARAEHRRDATSSRVGHGTVADHRRHLLHAFGRRGEETRNARRRRRRRDGTPRRGAELDPG